MGAQNEAGSNWDRVLTFIVFLDAAWLQQFVAVIGGAFEAELVPGSTQCYDFLRRVDGFGAAGTNARHFPGRVVLIHALSQRGRLLVELA